MGSLSIGHWLIVLVVVVLIFGTRKLKDAGRDLGGAVRSFKEGLSGPEGAATPKAADPAPVIEGEVRDRRPS
jgi:sec-independent protein translocase protein TatA